MKNQLISAAARANTPTNAPAVCSKSDYLSPPHHLIHQHSINDCTISSGVMGMYGVTSRCIWLPVIAAVIMTLSIEFTLPKKNIV